MATHLAEKPSTITAHPAESTATADTYATAPAAPVNSTDYAGYAPSSHATNDGNGTTATDTAAPAEKPQPHIDTSTADVKHARIASTSPTANDAGPGSALTARSTGLASALETSGHSISKVDARHLKQEIKNEKQTSVLLAKEEKADANEITGAIAHAKACVKDVDRCRKFLESSQKTLTNRMNKEAKAQQAFLKAQEVLNEAKGRTVRAKEELDVAERRHVAAVATKEASDIRVEQLRTHKAIHDIERERKQAEALHKMTDAERALAESGHQKKFGCF